MLFVAPELQPSELAVIQQIEDLKQSLRYLTLQEPRRWLGSLRRTQSARALQGSNSIEGYDAALDDAVAVELGEEPLDADEETRRALAGYRDAMTYVLQLANDEGFVYSDQLLKSLHFMMTSYDLKNRPGLWRAGQIFVRNDETEEIVYEGSDVEAVPVLMSELSNQLNQQADEPPMIRAAMAHLNLVMIHPFRDGNGRMARCLQTLVLAREGTLAPVFCSIEEYLGRNTLSYYDVLAEVGGGSWHPERDSRPWVRFILTAHLRQARTVVRRVNETERLWDEIERLVGRLGVPERSMPVLLDAANGFRVRNVVYRAMLEHEISEAVASRDLRLLVEAGLLAAHGEKRGRFYTASEQLRALRLAVVRDRDRRDDRNPFAGAA